MTTKAQILQFQIHELSLLISLAAKQERWPAKTYIDGENVGGQFKPLDGSAASGDDFKPKVNDWLDSAFGKGLTKYTNAIASEYEAIIPGIKQAIENNPVADALKSAQELKQNIEKGISETTVGQAVSGIYQQCLQEYNKLINQLNNLDSQPKLVQHLGKIAAAAIPIALAITTAAIPPLAIEALFPVLAASKLIGIGSRILQIKSMFDFAKTAVELDRHARGVDEESLKKSPKWQRYLEATRALVVGGIAGFGIVLGAALVYKEIENIENLAANREVSQTLKEIEKSLPARKAAIAERTKKLADELAARPIPADIYSHITIQIQQKEAQLLKDFADNPKFPKLLDAANTNLSEIIHDSEIYIRCPIHSIKKITEEGFKNKFDEKIFKQKIFAEELNSRRLLVEENLFGIGTKSSSESRPVYGIFARNGKHELEEGSESIIFGNAAIRLKRDVKLRSSLTNDDSFLSHGKNSTTSLYNSPSAITFLHRQDNKNSILTKLNATAKADNINDLRNIDSSLYIEAQIHGGILPEDISEIVYTTFTKEEFEVFRKLVTKLDYKGLDDLGKTPYGKELKSSGIVLSDIKSILEWAEKMGVKISGGADE